MVRPTTGAPRTEAMKNTTKKPYTTPKLQSQGSVEEITQKSIGPSDAFLLGGKFAGDIPENAS